MRKVLVFGATSAIAAATTRRFAQAGDSLFLVARNPDRLQHVTDDLKVRGATQVHSKALDINNYSEHASAVSAAAEAMGGLDTVLIAHGTLPTQRDCEQDFGVALRELTTNALSVISILTLVANRFEQQRHGCIAVISSVAGDRGRQSNYVYGAAKAAVSTFLSGLRNRLQPAGVQVLTIKPGFVDTPMTKEFQKNALWAQPDAIAAGIIEAIESKRDVVYLPWFWRWIMLIIRSIPEAVFKRLKL